MGTVTAGDFASQLRRLREAAGLSQEELAHRAGLTPNAIGSLERGERKRPYANTVRALAEALALNEDGRTKLLAAVPPRGKPAASSGSLPVPPTALVGRDDDVQAVVEAFRSRQARIVTLTGPGGVGKTRLAIEVASELAKGFPDGVIFVDLAPLDRADLFLPSLAWSLGLRQTQSVYEPLRETLARRRLMLLLDNFEHVMDAAVEVAALLEASPGLSVLTTSRAPLRIRGEREYNVGPLGIPDPGALPNTESVLGSAAGQLFLERAREAESGFVVDRNNAATIAAICWRLEGLPLALELVAAQMRFLGPASLLARIDEALQTEGARDLPERQRTMRATLDWDHDLLSKEEQIAFRRLGPFAGGFNLDSASAVITGGDIPSEATTRLIGQLVEKSLVTPDQRGVGDGLRYRMLEPVRQYSIAKLAESEERVAVRGRHADYFSGLAERAGPHLRSAGQLEWMETLAQEHDNVRASLGHLLEQGEFDRIAGVMWHLWLFWLLRGHADEGQGWAGALLAHPEAGDRARQKALWVAAMFSYMRGDTIEMIRLLEQMFAVGSEMDDEVAAYALMLRGHGLSQIGELEQSETFLQEALARARQLEDLWSIPHALQGLAHVAIARGDLASALEAMTESLEVARQNGDRWTLGIALTVHSVVDLLRGDDSRSESMLRECAQVSLEIQDAFTTAYSLIGLAVVAGRRGDGHLMARLAGGADSLREMTAIDISSTIWQRLFEEEAEQVRTALGPEVFDAARTNGRAMELEELIGEDGSE